MASLGCSLNNLSLFGLVLAFGIVVDDAIVVVENVERWMAKGLPPREATIKALEEITGPVIAITLVLSSVFIPTAFIAGISGQFYRQFALTIAASTIISAINAMTMAPARAVTLIKPHAHGEERREALPRTAVVLLGALFADFFLTGRVQGLFGLSAGGHGHEAHGSAVALWAVRLVAAGAGGVVGYRLNERVNRGLLAFFRGFNRVFERVTEAYGGVVARLVRATALLLAVYAGFMVLTWLGFRTVPTGFIPDQDKGYLVVNAQLPDGASLERTEDVMARLDEMVRATPGVQHTIRLPGYSILTSNNISNVGGMFVILQPFEDRVAAHLPAAKVAANFRGQFRQIQDAIVVAFGAPPVDGLGNTGGFKLQVQDRADAGPEALQGAVESMIRAGTAQPGLVGLFSSFRAAQPQLYLDVDRAKAKELPATMSFECTELTLQQILAGNTAVVVFVLGAVLVFMVLSAQYESWSLPGAIILIVPMCLLAAISGVWLVGSDNNIFTQVGLVVLIGLAAKNAILIVEFAKQLQDEGKPRFEAIVEASKTRLRPILMTSFAFILGVLPLVRTAGAGAEMRFALGIAVFSGMVGVTVFGIFFTPVFYEVIRGWTDRRATRRPAPAAPVGHEPEPHTPRAAVS